MKTSMLTAILVAMIVGLCGCSREKIQNQDPKSETLLTIDFNDADRRAIADNAVQSILGNAVITKAAKAPVILVGEKFLKNLTEKHINHKAVVDMIVNAMVASGKMTVIDMDVRSDLHDEYQYHATGYVDPTTVKGPGKEIGADYILIGRIVEDVQRKDNATVVNYMTTLELIDISTKAIKWHEVKEIKRSKVKTAFGL